MRPIKFRCYNTAAKCYYPKEHFALDMDGRTLQLMPQTPDFENGSMIFEQFTGLLDKKGQEIYEGDIVNQEWGAFNLIGVMYFNPDKASFGFEYTFNTKVDLPKRIEMHEPPEVIGNIRENPELLKLIK